MERWVGRVAVVTGASAGIGAAIAKLLTQHGMKVVGVARRVERVQALSDELAKENAKGTLHAIQGDVSKEEEIQRIVKWTADELGGIDVLVNNAGCGAFAKLSEISASDIAKILNLNVVGLTLLTRDVVQNMKSRGVNDGHIFHINSVVGHEIINYPTIEMYTASKHAVTVLTEGLRRELRDMGTKIRVTSISPGSVKTEIALAGGMAAEDVEKMYNENPYLEPVDIANALLFALSAPAHVQVHEMIIHPTGEF
ncbi:farnesol dehydrogenase-like [Neocloeon triangulifer]|uniref:farnesol dehydrogenase-like n=1 Tax=Neocloeon triangulifer TaxID=2078957 RepID=UPI00286F56DA|nr:farnesol dehydrogenase-like [Neocloeon triangulifer]